MTTGMIGRKVGMMRLFDGAGRVRGVTVIELGPNYVTQVRSTDRDGYSAVQLGFPGARKRVNRPQRGHLRAANLDGKVLTALKEWRVDDAADFALGQEVRCEQFTPGTYVDVTARSKGRGFQGGVKRWHFSGGPKTHGQSDRHRAPGSIGSGTTPGRVFKGLKMAGHMGDETKTVLNLLVVAVDPEQNLIFVEGSAPGARDGLVYVRNGRKPALTAYAPPALPSRGVEAAESEPEAVAEEAPESAETAPEAAGEQSSDQSEA